MNKLLISIYILNYNLFRSPRLLSQKEVYSSSWKMYFSMQTGKLHEANPRFWFEWYTLQSREEQAICGGIILEGEWQAIFPKIYLNSTCL